MTTAIGYIRVSTDKQAEEGVSLEAQEAKIRAYCDLYELTLVGIEVDAGKSAKEMTKRDGLKKALKHLEDGSATHLIVTKIDRLSRSIVDMGILVKKYFKNQEALISINDHVNTSTATGRMFLNMIVMFSEYEREVIGERTSEALKHLKSKGVSLGPAPLGKSHSEDVDQGGRRKIVDNRTEELTVSRIQSLKGLSLRKICKILTDEGHKTKRGGKWHPQSVKLVLGRNPLL